jgi:hypothetical protein
VNKLPSGWLDDPKRIPVVLILVGIAFIFVSITGGISSNNYISFVVPVEKQTGLFFIGVSLCIFGTLSAKYCFFDVDEPRPATNRVANFCFLISVILFISGSLNVVMSFNVPSVFPQGAISTSSNPTGASIYIDNTYVGETPKILNRIEQGSHNITLKLEGYENWIQTVNVEAGKTALVSKTLKPLPKITFNYTTDTAHIEENMNGTAKNIPEGDEIWIFVHPHTVNKYYPQRSSAVIQNGEWSLSVGIGSENDAGTEFDIIAVLADAKAQEEINAYFETCEKTGEWPGMDKIPDNAKEYDRITVTRLPITPEIKITSPLDGAQVDITESVKGTQKNIAEDKTLWIVVFPHESNNYHPVEEVPIHGDTSDFSVTVTLGRQESVGEKFDIIAMLADETAQEKFTNYLKTAADNNWQGIDLPDGTEEYSRITVTRK